MNKFDTRIDMLRPKRSQLKKRLIILSVIVSFILMSSFYFNRAKPEKHGIIPPYWSDEYAEFNLSLFPATNDDLEPLGNVIPNWKKDPIIHEPYSDSDLEWATNYLRLPTWSRGYVRCNSKETEISCAQIITAAKRIKEWDDRVMHSTSDSIKFIFRFSPGYGQANVMYIDIFCLALAMYADRCYAPALDPYKLSVVMNTPDDKLHTLRLSERGFYYPPTVYKCIKLYQAVKDNPKVYFGEEFDWRSDNISYIKDPKNPEILNISQLHYPVFLYSRPGVSEFLRQYFGYHFTYIVGSYVARIPEAAINKALEIFKKFPRNAKILTAHFRTLYLSNWYSVPYSHYYRKYNIFKDHFYDQNNGNVGFIVCADDAHVMKDSHAWNHSELIVSGDPDPMVDLALMIGADEKLLTLRSTYSIIASNFVPKSSFYFDFPFDYAIKSWSSQSFTFDPFFHLDDKIIGQPSMHFHIEPDNEDYLQFLYNEFGV